MPILSSLREMYLMPILCNRSKRYTTNTRFLTNVVRGVQSHNRAVLSASAGAEVGQSQERGYGSRSDVDEGGKWGESSEQGKRMSKMRGWSDDEDQGGGQEREGRITTSKSTSRRETTSSTSDRKSHRHRSSSRDRRDKDRHRSSRREKDRDSEDRHRRRSSQSPHRHASKSETSTAELPSSKMDRYFDEKYDPMLDVKAETRQDENGLIEDDGWERMLQAVKDKEERKRARKENKKSHQGEVQVMAPKVGADVMQTHYTSRGKLREWDKGKDTLS